MARSFKIPLVIYPWYEVVYEAKLPCDTLPSDARVVVGEFPEPRHIEVTPFRSKKRYLAPGKLSKHYEIRYVKELTLLWSGKPSPNRGKLIARVSPQKLRGLAPQTSILFMHDGQWYPAQVGEYEDPILAQEAIEKVEKRQQYRYRKHLRRRTIWDLLRGD